MTMLSSGKHAYPAMGNAYWPRGAYAAGSLHPCRHRVGARASSSPQLAGNHLTMMDVAIGEGNSCSVEIKFLLQKGYADIVIKRAGEEPMTARGETLGLGSIFDQGKAGSAEHARLPLSRAAIGAAAV